MEEQTSLPRTPILLNPDKVTAGEFYHFTFPPKRQLRESDFPMDVIFQVNGQDLPGQLLEAGRYRIFELPHRLVVMATGMGWSAWIAHTIETHPGKTVDSRTTIYVWKGRLNLLVLE
ncbi:MAG: hypothetical protein H6546_02110 [Chitinophagales bacterium]|nr:hypothetical protein [Chitinophagales bacterium]